MHIFKPWIPLVSYFVCLYRSDPEHAGECNDSSIPENATFPSAWGWLDSAQFEMYDERGTNNSYPSWKLHVSIRFYGL